MLAFKKPTFNARIKALALDWLIWAYIPAAIAYYFRDTLAKLPYRAWIYLASIPIGLVVALILENTGTSLGERIVGLAPERSEETPLPQRRTPWYRTQVGVTAALVGIITFVLGWKITQINLYYVFTRADRMANMTDRLLRPYWPVMGTLIEKMIETIFLALMATVISIPLAALVSFFAARNLMQPVTTSYGAFAAALVGAIGGMVLGAHIVDWGLNPWMNTQLDTELLRGILKPLFILIGMLGGGIAAKNALSRLIKRGNHRASQGIIILLTGVLGTLAAYLVASAIATIIFGASWSIFVRDLWPWPLVVLAFGAVAGLYAGTRRNPSDPFPIGPVIYNTLRFILNATRSIEPFVWALIFVTWFRLGPFPGMVALMVHSVAALGKLYSEQIESIDSGPLEAVRSTGANELQTIVYAVIPQIIPPFISFPIYRWDINVRMSTIIGLVGGGGIGQMLFQYQNLAQWRSVSVAIILIVTVVMTLDYLSARIRERIV